MAKPILTPQAHACIEGNDHFDLIDRRDMRLAQLRAATGMMMCIDADNVFVLDNLRTGYASLLLELVEEVELLTQAIEKIDREPELQSDAAAVQVSAAAKSKKPNGANGHYGVSVQ